MYFVKANSLLQKLFPKDLVWKKDTASTVYLTFDDGPHTSATDFVLDELEKYQAKATFFCIGKNVIEHPDVYHRILMKGHRVGNHTNTHINGWKANTKDYVENIGNATQYIDSTLFRPPYGKIKYSQANKLKAAGFTIVMWDVLCGDFDTSISPEKCWENIALNIEPGSVIVFHDSTKAFERLKYVLPRTLAFCTKKKWKMEVL